MQLARSEFDVHLVVPIGTDPSFLEFLKDLDVSVHHFSPAITGTQIKTLWDRVTRRINKVQSENAMIRTINEIADSDSVVHVDLSPLQAFRSLRSLSKRYQVFTTIHNSMPPHSPPREFLWHFYLRSLSKSPNFHLFSGNHDTKSYLSKYLRARDAELVRVTSTSVNPGEIEAAHNLVVDRARQRQRFGIPTDKFLVLTVGQFVDRKGRWILLEAASKVLSDRNDVVFVWVMPTLPNGVDLSKLESFGIGNAFVPIASSDIGSDRISILSFIKGANVFVLPSLVEGLPIAVLEAMALAYPQYPQESMQFLKLFRTISQECWLNRVKRSHSQKPSKIC